jgi:hypothetical protein
VVRHLDVAYLRLAVTGAIELVGRLLKGDAARLAFLKVLGDLGVAAKIVDVL